MAFFGTSEQISINLWACSCYPGHCISEDSIFCAMRKNHGFNWNNNNSNSASIKSNSTSKKITIFLVYFDPYCSPFSLNN